MNELLIETMDEVINSSDEQQFDKNLKKLTVLVSDMTDSVTKNIFWSAMIMLEDRSFSKKKEIIECYKKLFIQVGGECIK